MSGPVRPPEPHAGGARPPAIAPQLLPRHVALVMDGNGRWAKERGLPRTEGHKRGEHSLFDVIMGAIELGIPYLSAYAFSTENWRRSPEEVRFLMGFNRDVIRRRRDQLNEMGVRVRWAGRRPRLWRSVISELEDAERMTVGNSVLTLQFCVNYGGRAEIADAAAAIAADVAAGRLKPGEVNEKVFARYLDEPGNPGRGPFHQVIGRAADVQLPDLAVGLRGVRVPRHALSRFRPPSPVARLRDLRQPGPPVRGRQAEPAARLERTPARPGRRERWPVSAWPARRRSPPCRRAR